MASRIEQIIGEIEEYIDGVPQSFWNGSGFLSIEDRSSRGVCPAVRVKENDSQGSGQSHCTIYVRWVKDDRFYDGGFLNEWYREEPDDLWDQYLYDTVTMDNLQGVWYSEYTDSAGLYRTVLHVYGDQASIFETVDGRISDTWNGDGNCFVQLTDYRPNHHVPELLIKKPGASAGLAGIYISQVDDDKFYDAAFDRWYVRVPMECSDGEGYQEGNLVFTIYGGNAEKEGDHYILHPAEEGQSPLILDKKTELVNPEQLDGYKAGFNAVQWMDNLCSRVDGTGASGVYDTDITGNHIDRVYGLYWWD